jgi:hypothetical protein
MTRTLSLLSNLTTLTILIALARPVAADSERVLVVPTGTEPGCLDQAAATRAIERHTARPAVLVESDLLVGVDPLTVRLSTAGGMARIDVRRGNHTIDAELAIEPCDALPDQIAAFVAGAIATLIDDTPVFDERARAQRRRAERAAILAEVWHDKPVVAENLAGSMAVNPVITSIFTLADEGVHDDDTRSLIAGASVAAGIAAVAAGVDTYDHTPPVTVVGAMVASGLMSLALDNERDDPGARWTGISLITAGLGYGLAEAISSHRVSRRRGKHHAMLSNPRLRDAISETQLAAVEADLRTSSTPIPRWLRPLPFVVAALVDVGYQAQGYDERDEAAEKRHASLVVNFVWSTAMSVLVALPTPLETARKRLHAAGLQLGATPTASGATVSLGGAF